MSNKVRLKVADTGEEYMFDLPRILLGRGNTCNIVLPKNMLMVARCHAEILIHRNVKYIRDYASTNGTWLNGVRLESGKLYVLHTGDEIVLARSYKLTVLEA